MMTNKQREAFEKFNTPHWVQENGKNCDMTLPRKAFNAGWQAAKASSEQRIAELEAEVKAYQDEQVAYTMKVAVERIELQAHINRLREALGVLVRTGELQMNDDRHQLYVEVSKSDIRKAKKALALTPAQSLKAHDDELIDKCVQAIINVGGKRVWEFADAVKSVA